MKLYFSEPGDVSEGDRVFDVALQGAPVLRGFDIRKEAGGRSRIVVRSFESVALDDTIDVTFTPSTGRPLLCGIEVVMLKD